MSRNKDKLTLNLPSDFNLLIISDGTTTTAEVTQQAGLQHFRVGYGVARRKKGDRRNPDLGTRLALSRCFKDAAKRLDDMIGEEA